MLEMGALLWHEIETEGAYFYTCGDENMIRGVEQSVKSIIEKFGNKSEVAADQYLKNLRQSHRYNEDSFGVLQIARVNERNELMRLV